MRDLTFDFLSTHKIPSHLLFRLIYDRDINHDQQQDSRPSHPTTKAAHNKIHRDIANKYKPTAVTEVIKDYANDSDVCENSQDALSQMVELKKSRV